MSMKGYPKQDVHHIPISQIEVVKGFNCRKDFNAAALDELKADIKSLGLLQPILVRQQGKFDSGANKDKERFLCVAGERRLRAMKSLKEKTIPARVLKVNEQEAYAINLAENLDRSDLNPIETAMGLRRCTDKEDVKATAKRFGRTVQWVRETLKLLELDDKTRKEVATGKLAASAARETVGMSTEERRSTLKEAAKDRKAAGGKKKSPSAKDIKKQKAEKAVASGGDVKKAGFVGMKEVKKKLESLQEKAESGDAKTKRMANVMIATLRWVVGETKAIRIPKA